MALSKAPIAPALIEMQEFSRRQGTTTLPLHEVARQINTLPLTAMADPAFQIDPQTGGIAPLRCSTTIWLDRSAFSGNALSAHRLGDLLFVSELLGSGVSVYSMAGTAPILLAAVQDTAALRLEGISAMTSLQTTTGPLLIVASQSTDSVSVLRIGAAGNLQPLSSIGADALLPVHLPSQIGAVTLNGQHFVLLGASGSASLTVLRLGDDGSLTYVEQILDSRNSRFGGLSAMDILVLGGQVLIAVAGNDGGVSLFQLLPSGRLILRESLEDSLSSALQNVVDLQFVVVGDQVELFVLAAGDGGVTRLVLDPARFGPNQVGLVATTSLGSAGHDILTAPPGTVTVLAGAGDDIVSASAGATTMDGGDGADIFVLQPDAGRRDTVLNFNPAQDRIDLSAFAMLYGMEGLVWQSTATGALLHIGTTEIALNAGRSLTADTLAPALLFGSARLATPPILPRSTALPPGSDADSFLWAPGPRTYDGGSGVDRLDYSAANSGARIDLQDSTHNSGAALNHNIRNIEEIIGSALADQIGGDALANTLQGRAGDDSLEGRAGDDWITPGTGNDTVTGGEGVDTVSFADAVAGVSVNLLTGLASGAGETDLLGGIENITGSAFDDALIGNDQANLLLAALGDDWITPGAGSDTVDGGDGTDMVSFFDALSRAVIDLALGTAVIGAETDVLQNIENITGTIFGDLITGDAGANRIRALGDYDWLVGSGGGDLFEGGTGRDTVAYSSAAAGVTASLLSDTGTAGQANGDRYIDVENLTGGSFADRLTGDADRNILRGLGGDDFLFGLAGADTIDGGAGRDSIDGGLGNDRMTGGRGNDTADGGANWDVAVYSGTRAQYTVTRNAAGSISVLHNGGGVDGVDLLFNTEALQFSDGLIFL